MTSAKPFRVKRPIRVKLRRTQPAQMSSGLPLKADIARYVGMSQRCHERSSHASKHGRMSFPNPFIQYATSLSWAWVVAVERTWFDRLQPKESPRMNVNKLGICCENRPEKCCKINGCRREKSVRDAGVAGSNPATPTNPRAFAFFLERFQG